MNEQQDTNYVSYLAKYLCYLKEEEKSKATQEMYGREISAFLSFANGEISKDSVLCYKEKLEDSYQANTINAKLAALNGFFTFLDRPDLKVRQVRVQRRVFCEEGKELSKEEYFRLVEAAKSKKNERLSLLLQAICGTGIRVSELCFITVEAVCAGQATVRLKGKTRTILIGRKLEKALKAYIKEKGIVSGPVFVTKSGKPLDRSNIWKMMKALCKSAGIDEKKVFPHNLRHLFAKLFYKAEKDISRLADVLGHTSINTTRMYIISSGKEHMRQIDALGLIV